MNSLRMRKGAGVRVSFDEGQRLLAGAVYKVSLSAPEYREDATSSSEFELFAGGVRIAGCALVPDPLRRGLRASADGSHLEIPAYREDVQAAMRVGLGDGVLVYTDVRITGVDDGGESVPVPSSARWTVVDLGVVTSGAVQVSDMVQVKLTAPVTSVPLSVTAASGQLDAYVVVASGGSAATRFPFTGVTVNGSEPVWAHQDSLLMPARKWVVRIAKVADDYYADLRAGRPGGTEMDPDGAAVVSAEVNS